MTQPKQPHQMKQWWHAPVKAVASTRPVAWLISYLLPPLDSFVLRHTGGRYSAAALLGGLLIVTLTTTGAKSGRPRTVTLIAIPDGHNLIFIASNWGQKRHPAWYHNMRAHPRVEVVQDGWRQEYAAHEAQGSERERCWNRALEAYPGYAAYARRVPDRIIPVMVCEPIGRQDQVAEGPVRGRGVR